MLKNDKRFITIHEEGKLNRNKIIVDTETGVHYLYVSEGYSGGLTPLLDEKGNVVVKKM